ncbi:keratin, type I cytoskeletal 9-like [Frankliniella occidentalis]|uniref:Keratin, type I cytoskeletal 9-like n=1 Tax=Frankliniella occidentalis TaxID=133901 RepID=A0A9C6X4W9_FRAOC|nr:keratin, type I cytoskeletal 9-like [Frankliniella occidentalis]
MRGTGGGESPEVGDVVPSAIYAQCLRSCGTVTAIGNTSVSTSLITQRRSDQRERAPSQRPATPRSGGSYPTAPGISSNGARTPSGFRGVSTSHVFHDGPVSLNGFNGASSTSITSRSAVRSTANSGAGPSSSRGFSSGAGPSGRGFSSGAGTSSNGFSSSAASSSSGFSSGAGPSSGGFSNFNGASTGGAGPSSAFNGEAGSFIDGPDLSNGSFPPVTHTLKGSRSHSLLRTPGFSPARKKLNYSAPPEPPSW